MKIIVNGAFALLAILCLSACITPNAEHKADNAAVEQPEIKAVKAKEATQTQPLQGILYDPDEVWDGNKISKSDEAWKKILTDNQYQILRHHATEAPRSGEYEQNKRKGVYYCGGCGLPLFHSETKFESGTGWPSFFKPIHQKNVGVSGDNSHGMVRDEVHCNRCDGHLGHVFDDGPEPTGLRYCINSGALYFQETK